MVGWVSTFPLIFPVRLGCDHWFGYQNSENFVRENFQRKIPSPAILHTLWIFTTMSYQIRLIYALHFLRAHFWLVKRLRGESQVHWDTHTRRGSKGGEMGEFSPLPPLFLSLLLFFFLSLKYWCTDLKQLNQALLHYYKNSPPISKSWIRACTPIVRDQGPVVRRPISA